MLTRAEQISNSIRQTSFEFGDEDIDDIEDAPEMELETTELEILDQATAANSIVELKAETEILKKLEDMALWVRRSGNDTKWSQLREILINDVFTSAIIHNDIEDTQAEFQAASIPRPKPSKNQKLVIFTEHRDTLRYLQECITTLLGRPEAVVTIHGSMAREERAKAQEAFLHNPDVQILLATDAAGEGINLQRAYLMVNYDLPWNPNRIEQRFGRIHRIGQTEPCHLWNLVAEETREGDVYQVLLRKLEDARKTLQGQVFDVLGNVQFDGKPLKDLMIQAIRYGEKPEVKAKLTEIVSNALDTDHLRKLLDERALTHDILDATRVYQIREDMERAEARRLQPHYIESFFLKAFEQLGGVVRQREPRRYEVTRVPAVVRNADRLIGTGNPVLTKYERIVFEKSLIYPQGETPAAFVCPGHPLLDAVVDIILERNRDLLRRGAVLVDENDTSTQPRVLFYLEHSIQDATRVRSGERRLISKQMLYVEIDAAGKTYHPQYAPYLDYRPLKPGEPDIDTILSRPECRLPEYQLVSQSSSCPELN